LRRGTSSLLDGRLTQIDQVPPTRVEGLLRADALRNSPLSHAARGLVAEGTAATLCREGSRLDEIEAMGRGTFHEHRTDRTLAAALEAGA
jgi:hypothetical protein